MLNIPFIENSFKSKLKTTREFGCTHDIIRKHSLVGVGFNEFYLEIFRPKG